MKNLLFFLMFAPLSLSAQLTIRGTVKGADGRLLDGVTVRLLSGGAEIAHAVADSGRFSLVYKAGGEYEIKASLVGYVQLTRLLVLPADTVELLMAMDVKSLGAVQVVGNRPLVERKTDRAVFNVEGSAIASSGTVWDALGKAPGVQVRSDNSVSADKKSVQVYLDGKPLHMTGDDLASYLQGMASSMISTIEVFSNPPANFDASGGSVINIITKKSKASGFNGTVSGGYTQASHSSYNGGAVFNYRKAGLNLYGNYSYTDRAFIRDHDEYVNYANASGTSFWDSRGRNLVTGRTNGYSLGADYQVGKDQAIGFQWSGTMRTGHIKTMTPTAVYSNGSPIADSTLMTDGRTRSHINRQAYGINYNGKFDSGRQTLNIDLDYSPYQYSNLQYVDNKTAYGDGHPTSDNYHIFTDGRQGIHIYWGNIDYGIAIGQDWKLSAGAKYSSIRTDSRFDFYDNGVGGAVYLPDNSNHFLYSEKTAAAYAGASGSVGALTIDAGLRFENTHTRGDALNLDSVNKRNYFKVFPSLGLSYKVDEDHEWQLHYSYRVDRPSYAELNPAKHYSNPYNYLVGNPALQPAYIQNAELAHVLFKNYTIAGFYTATHGFFSNSTIQDNVNHRFFDTFNNLDLSMSTGLKFSVSLHPLPWWEMSGTIQGYYMKEKSAYLEGRYDYHTLAFDGNMLQSFTIDRRLGLKAEISAFYYSRGIQAVFINEHLSEVDAGVKMNVLRGRGTVKVAVNDIFFGNSYRIRVNYLAQNNGFFQSNDTRNGSLTFTYRFGGKSSSVRRRAVSEEERRLQ